ncbi:GNAT family N-acetyltransferase [Brevibacillus dissolubilis]|uniref:GNAT family N-acetyltransferase n=1 Tax=Brevibacillus dissolubilis TaxID=1844116 RepID=UPI001116FE8D|nr:GNAT family N-acetyltransferase [Brevibacillus dissolubilis]
MSIEQRTFEVKEIDESLRPQIVSFITESWGSPIMVSRGIAHSIDQLPGYVALENGEIRGLITYRIQQHECEIVSLDSLVENQGLGSRLTALVEETAQRQGCHRVWLITSNDNTHAIRFYQKRGFTMCALHLHAINEARKIKPQIPLIGYDGIPIEHEVELEKAFEKEDHASQ